MILGGLFTFIMGGLGFFMLGRSGFTVWPSWQRMPRSPRTDWREGAVVKLSGIARHPAKATGKLITREVRADLWTRDPFLLEVDGEQVELELQRAQIFEKQREGGVWYFGTGDELVVVGTLKQGAERWKLETQGLSLASEGFAVSRLLFWGCYLVSGAMALGGLLAMLTGLAPD